MHHTPQPWVPFPVVSTLRSRTRVLDLNQPRIMGIVNLTPDSFSDGGLYLEPDQALARAGQLLAEGADILDLGGQSSRPGAEDVPPEEELRRLLGAYEPIRARYPDTWISIDTYRAPVAQALLARGADIINDISGGALDEHMWPTVAAHGAAYVLMHMQGTPQTMQQNPTYTDVVQEVSYYLADRLAACRASGVPDVVVDPGFGFGKAPQHNWQLWGALPELAGLGAPLLVGISRKSMLSKLLQRSWHDLQFAQEALHLEALKSGARILRVHEVAPTRQVVDVFCARGAF